MVFPDLSPVSPLAVYFHFPFCAAKCDYCDFYSVGGVDTDVVDSVVRRMARDFRETYGFLGRPTVASVYLGGGTPSSVGAHTIGRFLDQVLTTAARPVPEVSVEVNPRDLREELLKALTGVTRLSIGVQSFDHRTRAVLGRRGGGIDRTSEALLFNWSGRLNIDLIQCIPGQTRSSARADLRRAVALPTDHLSVYSLAISPGTALADRLVVPREEGDEWAEMTEMTVSYLAAEGFHRYEVSNYARPGCESVHNSTYWTGRPYLGIGPGAVSTLFDPDGNPVRVTVEESLSTYAERGRDACRVEKPSPAETLLERFMLGLRTREGVDLEDVHEGFLSHPRAARRISGGELTVNDDRLVATEQGLLCLDAVLVDLAVALEARPTTSVPWDKPD